MDLHHAWVNQHAADCPVTRGRADLLADLARDPHNRVLRGAVPEYDRGGDQEVELCVCPTMERFGGHYTQ